MSIQSILQDYRNRSASWKETVQQLVNFDYASPVPVDTSDVSAVALLGGLMTHRHEDPVEQHEANLRDFATPATGVDGDFFESEPIPGVINEFIPGSFDEVRKAVNDGILDIDLYEMILQGLEIRRNGGVPELVES